MKNSTWQVVEFESQNKKYIVRLLNQEVNLKFPVRLGIAFKINNPDPYGFPSNPELELLNALENELLDVIDKNKNEVVFGLSILGGEISEKVLYLSDSDLLSKYINIVNQIFVKYKVTSNAELDTNWSVYSYFKSK